MAIVTVTFETDSAFSDKEIVEVKGAFADFIEEMDDDAKISTLVVTAMSKEDAEIKRLQDMRDMLNKSIVTAMVSIDIKGNDEPYEIELAEKE